MAGGLELKPPFLETFPLLDYTTHPTELRIHPSQQRRDERQRLPTLAPTNKICPPPSDLEPRSKKRLPMQGQWRKRLPDLSRPRTIPQFFKLPMKRPLHRPVATDQGVPIHLSIAQRGSKKGGMFHYFFDLNLRYEAPHPPTKISVMRRPSSDLNSPL